MLRRPIETTALIRSLHPPEQKLAFAMLFGRLAATEGKVNQDLARSAKPHGHEAEVPEYSTLKKNPLLMRVAGHGNLLPVPLPRARQIDL